jgi:hypothetical protein
MKTMILTAALVVLTATMFAQKVSENVNGMKPENSTVKVAMFSNMNDHITVIVVKQPEDKLNLKIKDEEGSVVYEKSLRKPENRKIDFDLGNLPEGNYTFEVLKRRDTIYTNSLIKGSNSIALSN